jgi:RNA polymerase sigma factor
MEQSQVTIEEVLANPKRIDEFISNQEPFILRSAARASGRFISKNDDEWSIALEGFLKAVQKYDQSRGGFFPFAEMVIHNSLVDQFRIDQKHQVEGLTDTFDEIAMVTKPEVEIRQEIVTLSEKLATYGIRFKDLADCSPKAEKTKRACAQAIRELLLHDDWRREMQSTKLLPVGKIQHITTIPRKILERHRKYIIAVTEILDGDYLYLADYVKHIKEGLR